MSWTPSQASAFQPMSVVGPGVMRATLKSAFALPEVGQPEARATRSETARKRRSTERPPWREGRHSSRFARPVGRGYHVSRGDMTATLQVTDGKGRGSSLPLQGKAIFEVGSAKTADLALEDGEVAATHLKVYCANGDYSVFDVSGQGFLHNGKRALKAAIAAGDQIQIGQHVLRLTTDEPAPPR